MSPKQKKGMKTCSSCINMRSVDGYCRRNGRYVNALDTAQSCYVSATEAEEELAVMPKIPRRRPKPKVEGQPQRRGRNYDLPDGEKYCPTCQRVLPKTAFARCKSKPGGVSYECKECAARKARERYARQRAERRKDTVMEGEVMMDYPSMALIVKAQLPEGTALRFGEKVTIIIKED